MFQYQFLPRQYYQSPYVQAIAGATGGADRARAAADLQEGQIDTQTASSVGQAASGTLHDFLNYRATQSRRDLESAQAGLAKSTLADKQRDDADTQAVRDAMQTAGGDHDAALQALEQRGAVGAATKLRSALTVARTQALDEQDKGLKLVKDRLSMASQLLQGVPESDDPSTNYANVLPKVREIVGPDLGKQLPDEYDPDRVGQAVTWGETAQQTLDRRRAALEAAREGVANSKDAREKDGYFTKSLAQWLPTVGSQDEWDKALAAAKSLGAPPETLAKFGDAFTPEAAQRAGSFSLTADERAKATQPGSEADFVTTYARELGKPVALLTTAEKAVALKRHAEANKVSDPVAAARLDEQRRHNRALEDPLGLSSTAGAAPVRGGAAPVGASPPAGGGAAASVRPGAVPGAAPADAPAAAGPSVQGQSNRNDDALSTLPPAVAAQVKAIADGKRSLDARTVSTPAGRQLLNLVYAYDPSFDQVNYNARYKTRADFTSGASSKNVNALNTVIGHLSDLSDAADALNNTWSPTWNSIANAVSSAAGNPQVKKFDTIQNAVADEATRVWRQAGGTEADIKAWRHDLDSAGSPEQLHGVIATIGDLLESKLGALQAQYEQGMGSSDVKVVTPAAAKALEVLRGRAGNPDAATATAAAPKNGDQKPLDGNGAMAEYRDGRWIRIK